MDYYYMYASPPCAAIQMFAKALGINLNAIKIDYEKNEQFSDWFLKINPQHAVPVIIDRGFKLSESRAILGYFADKYAKDDSFYPRDPQKRALVNSRLFFDVNSLYQRLADYFNPPLFFGQPFDDEKFKKIVECLDVMEIYLSESKYFAGDHITIADYSIFASFYGFKFGVYDFSKYPNIQRWHKLCEETLAGIDGGSDRVTEMDELKQTLNIKK